MAFLSTTLLVSHMLIFHSREIAEPDFILNDDHLYFKTRVQVPFHPSILNSSMMVGEDSIEGSPTAMVSPYAASRRKGDGLPHALPSVDKQGDSQPLLPVSVHSWIPPDGRCRAQDAAVPGGTLHSHSLVWCPTRNRYLMMICGAGRLCNRLSCIMNHMVAATFLNRTLVFPLEELGLPFDILIDVPRIWRCLGPSTVISLKDFRTLRHGDDHVDVMRFFDGHNPSIAKGISVFQNVTGITIGKSEVVTARQKEQSSIEFFQQFSLDVEVLSVGELFGVSLSKEANAMQHGREPWTTSCKGSILQPHKVIVSVALNFIRTFLGSRYTGVHLRRGDFLKACGRSSCFYPLPQLAKCIRRQLEATKASELLFLATDAQEEEVEELIVLLERDRPPIKVVRLSSPGEGSLEKMPIRHWNRHLTEEQRQVPQVISLVELSICALAGSFFFSNYSTFSREIRRLRTAWRLSTSRDRPICGGEKADWAKGPAWWT
ncbi:hypothetical protein CBR_g72643 [Chara braunii]|uniref:Uncharacterized protein n=1 Tax=Chara braunii TaxID=69332 RepID=A0A388KA06_CHABU|nr:hypothetical protein CBR_g72643 [Chara braunii]|eukprot:GBG66888.1 hypothetical protein CBR_g72643 [Chara braunii]